MIREGYEIANRFGHRPFVYQFLYAALEADLRTGEWDDNIAELDAIEENETPWPFYQIAFSGMRAMRAALRGDLASAEEMLRLADATLPELQSIQSEAFVQLAWAHVLFAAGRWEEAIEHGRQAGANSNFTIDAWWITANAAAAADLRPVLIEASEGIVSLASFPGPNPRCAPRRRPGRAGCPRGTMGRGACRLLGSRPPSHRTGRAVLRQPGGPAVGRPVRRPRSRCHPGRP